MTFDQWYFSKVGVTVEGARDRGVYDVDLMEQCWEAAVKQAREDALEGARKAVSSEEILDVEDIADDAYNCGVIDCVRAIESLKGKT